MNNEKKLNIEEALNKGIYQAPTGDFEKLAAIPVIKMTEHDTITRQDQGLFEKQWKMPKYFKPLSAALASCLVMFAGVSAWFVEFKTPDSVISLDANQSIEIVTNKHKQVLGVKAFDQEVQLLMDEKKINQGNLEDSVSVIISTMIENGYLDDSKNVVMVSVENESVEKANDLAGSLNQVIKNSATAQNVTTTVVTQSVVTNQEAVAQAEQYSVSAGKLMVMKELVATDSSLTMDALATMSVTDLLQVSKDKSIDLTKIIQVDAEESQKDKKDTETNQSETTDNSATVPSQTTNNNSNANTGNKEILPPVIEPIVVTAPETSIDIIPEPIDEKQLESVEEDKTTQELPVPVPLPLEEEKEKSAIEKDSLEDHIDETDTAIEIPVQQ